MQHREYAPAFNFKCKILKTYKLKLDKTVLIRTLQRSAFNGDFYGLYSHSYLWPYLNR